MRAIIVCILLCGQTFAQRQPLTKQDQTHKQIVIVECRFFDRTNHGSGILIDDRTALTALHCVRNDSLTIVYDGKEFEADVVRVHFKNDWALLRTREATNATKLNLRNNPVSDGEEVTAYGFGGFTERREKRVHWWRSRFDGKQLQGTTPISCDSGGPIFDSNGKLVSIVCDYFAGTDRWSGYGIKNAELAEWVK